MNISRRHLTGTLPVLGLVVFRLLGGKAAQAMSADDEAVAKRLEAFRVAQVAADAKAFEGLCAPELSYSHSDGRVEDKATFIKNATSGKSKMLSLAYQDPSIHVVGDVAIVRFHWLGERVHPRQQKDFHQFAHPDELAKTSWRVEVAISCVDQTLISATAATSPAHIE